MSYDDFCRLTPDEFWHVCKAFADYAEADSRGEWERMRMLAAITVQPHVKGRVTPQKLLPLPWEKPRKSKTEKPVSKEESKRRFEALLERVKS